MKPEQIITLKTLLRTVLVFVALLAISSTLIVFGARHDASTVAKNLKAGVLTADEVNVAFEQVGGRLVSRSVKESDIVRQGDILMTLDSTDIDLAISQLKAVITAQEATLTHEKESIRLTDEATDIDEATRWHRIEELWAALESARATLRLAKVEHHRASTLVKSGGVSQSVFDATQKTLKESEARVTQAQRQLDAATLGATKAELTKLAKTGKAHGMTLLAIQNTRAQTQNRRHQVVVLEANLRESQVKLAMLEVDRSRLTLKAPQDGEIEALLYEVGEMIPSNAPAVLLETSRQYFDIYVNEMQASLYTPGTRLKAYVPPLDREVEGTVRNTVAAPSFADIRMARENGQADITAFKVRIDVVPTEGLLTGMTLEVRDESHH